MQRHAGWLAPTPWLRRPALPALRRRTRGDGNCFFRSFCFGLLEGLLLGADGGEAARLVRLLEGLKRPLVEVGGYEEIGEGGACHACSASAGCGCG